MLHLVFVKGDCEATPHRLSAKGIHDGLYGHRLERLLNFSLIRGT